MVVVVLLLLLLLLLILLLLLLFLPCTPYSDPPPTSPLKKRARFLSVLGFYTYFIKNVFVMSQGGFSRVLGFSAHSPYFY